MIRRVKGLYPYAVRFFYWKNQQGVPGFLDFALGKKY